MRTYNPRRLILFTLPVVLLLVSLACTIPFIGSSGPKTPGAEEPGTGLSASEAPSNLLTQAAGTMLAPIAGTLTAEANVSGTQAPAQETAVPPAPGETGVPAAPTVAPVIPTQGEAQQPLVPGATATRFWIPLVTTPEAQPVVPVQPVVTAVPVQPVAPAEPVVPAATPTRFWLPLVGGEPAQPAQPTIAVQPPAAGQPTQFWVPLVTPQANLVPTVAVIPGGQPIIPGNVLPQPSHSFIPSPPAGFYVQAGQAFSILGVSLPNCNNILAANFLVQNNSSTAFESFSFQVTDLASGAVLFGPMTNNTPFMDTDQSCSAVGIETLLAGNSLFAGGSLGAPNLSGHTVRVELNLCTENGLGGQCYASAVEFVVP